MNDKRWPLRLLAHPYTIAAGAAVSISVLYSALQIHSLGLRWFNIAPAQAGHHIQTLAWKEPLLPAQFSQASCGACHRSDLPQAPRLTHGRHLLLKYNCVACHILQGIDRPEMLGPDLTNVGTKVTRAWIYKWLKNPRTLLDQNGNVQVDGVATNPRMPRFDLTDVELRALSAYLSIQGLKNGRPLPPDKIRPAKDADIEEGHTRFNQMFCVTCHAIAVDRGGEVKLIGGDIGPELTKAGSKVRAAWLTKWLRDPQSYLAHTRMPRYQWSDRDLYVVSQYILSRLTDQDLLKDVPDLGPGTDSEVQLGRRLFVDKGCAECHVIQGVTPRPSFGPDLSAEGLGGGQQTIDIDAPHDGTFQWHFVNAGVQRLHVSVSPAPKSFIYFVQAKITNPSAVTFSTRMPRFDVSQSDLDDMTTALLSMVGPNPSDLGESPVLEKRHTSFQPTGEAGRLYQQYRCFVCHSFNGYGGDLAPDLSYEGSRSRKEWLVQFLKDPPTLRPILTVRMPNFHMSDKDAAALADYISTNLRAAGIDPASIRDDQFTREMAVRGKGLFENKYQCQSCHTVGSAGGYVGPSLNNVGNWMTPAWIEAWLRNPQALVPGAVDPHRSFSESEIKEITAYLITLKQSARADAPAAGGEP
jgi:mono/diheme cytochrome c family protein